MAKKTASEEWFKHLENEMRADGKFEARKEANRAWWNSLTRAEREIIKWCREDKTAAKQSLDVAQVRETEMNEFYRLLNKTNNVPKKLEKYEFVWKNMEYFKQFVWKKYGA